MAVIFVGADLDRVAIARIRSVVEARVGRFGFDLLDSRNT